MALFKCKMCGGDLEIAEGVTIAECEYCGTKQTVPKVADENLQNLFNRANTLRIKSEFDKAEKLYEKIVQADESQAEAYWGLILCKYGIEYVDDPATFKKIPTCHRASYDSIIADEDYKAALENADAGQRSLYEEQAKEIDRIQRDILVLAQREETYDVFICYKETDASGHRTQDSVIANDIYYQLTQEGFKVFYAAITLEGKLGSAYEPIIFAALNSAKVMLSIGTKPEYFNAVWVKNEWSRFLKIIKKDRSKLLIPCYRDMDAYELPEEFAHLQAQDMSKIGFINDVVRGIKKVAQKDEKKAAVVTETVVTTANANTAPLLKRAYMFLEDGEWDRADDFCEQVLNIDPENAQAYLGKLMAELRVGKQEDLKDCEQPFDGNGNYQKAVRFADEGLKSALVGYIECINTRNENARLEGIYARAQKAMAMAKSDRAFYEAAQIFDSISAYMDSASLAEECREKAEAARKDAILLDGLMQANNSGNSLSRLSDAIKTLQKIPGWKDADELLAKCQSRVEEIKAKEEADRLERERKAEIARQEAERRAKRNKKIAIITTPIVCAIIAFIIVLNTVIIPNGKYNDAIALMDDGKYSEARSVFEALNGYKDSINKIEECNINIYGKKLWDKIKNVNVGDTYKFGRYEQDNNESNGQETIEWLVLSKKGTKILVISKYALDCWQYNGSYKGVTWETSYLRKWLNYDFINAAFSAGERAKISTALVSADNNPKYSICSGNDTLDQVFLLSINEVIKYFSSDSLRQCKPTKYAVAHGAWESDSGNCWWWLRSPGRLEHFATGVSSNGIINEEGNNVSSRSNAVRPAMWIDLSK